MLGVSLGIGAPAAAACAAGSPLANESALGRAEPMPSRSAKACVVSWERVAPTALRIDVRSEHQRRAVAIRGASVMSLSAPALADSAAGSIVLIGDGLNQRELLDRCESLRKSGATVTVLDGGVLALPAQALQTIKSSSLREVAPQAAVEALRADPEVQLVLVGTEDDPSLPFRHQHVSGQPDAAAVRRWAGHRGAVVLAGPAETTTAWQSALLGAGARRVFQLRGSVDDLIAIDTTLNELHQGRHWVPPTPCERQS